MKHENTIQRSRRERIMSEPVKIRSTNIRMRLALAVFFFSGLAMLVSLLGYWGMSRLRDGAELAMGGAVRIQELSQEFETEFLLARQAESAFLNNWRTIGFDQAAERYLTSNSQHLALAKGKLDLLQMLSPDTGSDTMTDIDESLAELRPLVVEYETLLVNTAASIEQRTGDQGSEQLARQQIETLLGQVSGLNNDAYTMLLLQMAANEQSFFNTLEQQHFEKVHSDADAFKELVANSATADMTDSGDILAAEELLTDMERHLAKFDELAQLEQDISANQATFAAISAEMNSLSREISRIGELELARLRQEFNRSYRTSVVSLAIGTAAALIIGLLVIGPVIFRISGVLGQFTRLAGGVGAGRLDLQVPVTGNDELTVLAKTFNQMTVQLQDLVGSLEQRVEDSTRALETSVQVSRGLSTVLEPKTLITEIVEQIRDAFNYYHTQIFLLDDLGENLVLAAATGQAGRAMLSQGHKLRLGQGLAGRAAASNTAVHIPDVSENPDWLPNPLLPDTQCEASVPIAVGDQVVGVLDVQDNRLGRLQQPDVALLQSIASQVAIALQNARLFDETRARAEREAALNVVNRRLQAATSVDDVLRIAVQELGQITQARRTTIELALSQSLSGGNGQETQQK
jgi:putative methionine-R-sulfoxide reductase with GAF domain